MTWSLVIHLAMVISVVKSIIPMSEYTALQLVLLSLSELRSDHVAFFLMHQATECDSFTCPFFPPNAPCPAPHLACSDSVLGM